MKKILRVITVILAVIALIIIAVTVLSAVLSNKKFVPDEYESSVETGGEIEEKYLAYGAHEVSYTEYALFQNFEKFEIYYPSDLETSDKEYPVVVVCNGSGLPASKYTNLFEHLASWGFIVIGTEETYAWNGFGAEMSIRFLTDLNEKETLGDDEEANIFFGKIDFDNIGITGHSQGGVGVFNAISAQEHGSVYKTAVSLSPTNFELAHNLYWDYDVSEIETPMLLICSSDENDYIDPEGLAEIYGSLTECSFKCMLTRDGATHNEMLYSADGYVTAWFMYWLQGDEEAKSAFFGDDSEIMSNALYQNVQISE